MAEKKNGGRGGSSEVAKQNTGNWQYLFTHTLTRHILSIKNSLQIFLGKLQSLSTTFQIFKTLYFCLSAYSFVYLSVILLSKLYAKILVPQTLCIDLVAFCIFQMNCCLSKRCVIKGLILRNINNIIHVIIVFYGII